MVAISSALHSVFTSAAASALWGDSSSGFTPLSGCDISTFVPTIPSGQTLVLPPTNATPSFIGLAFGVQNYTCTSAGTYTNVGAVAELIDVSCYVNNTVFSKFPEALFSAWKSFDVPILDIIDSLHLLNPPEILAQHYFVPNPSGTGLSPKWDFTSSGKFRGNSSAFLIGKGNGTLPSPDNSTTDVAWLEVLSIQGAIAKEVLRLDTVGGQPPASCKFGSSQNISVDYTANYLFYGH
ncbi:hypothetical protein B0H21DRAFT_35619 [Amylocystis lapponica]|nr:hypothetical protein B0H21DRAFT_35619 [Amylocystis lapponica]